MNHNFYITTTLPYVNATPHVGFASEIIYADVRARYEALCGKNVVFNTGTDEHGVKIYQVAQEQGVDPQEYVDDYAAKFDELKNMLNLSYTNFIRTTDAHHKKAAQEMWRRVDANGFIYKKQYQVKYCVGCEMEKTDSELEDGYCPLHPGKELEHIDEENYFFRFSAFGEQLCALYDSNPDFVVPAKRLNEIRRFVEGGLQDFSISRLREKMPWGVPVPGDDAHVMYVWFDALTNYISTLGWPADEKQFTHFWGTKEQPNAMQIAGKDNLRQQSAMWQAMLLAADLPPSKQIFINGFIGVDGQKMSKSIGNVIAPDEMVARYGVDGTRYLLLNKSNFGEDSDISWDKMDAKYNADLANGLGNLTARIITLAGDIAYDTDRIETVDIAPEMENMQCNKALEKIWHMVEEANKCIEDTKPWELRKTDTEAFETVMQELLTTLHIIADTLTPFMPQTSEKILTALTDRTRVILFEKK
ncbi:MAG: methionine--tRNA ligase [Candidatus Moraniibacteriota bacterium]|nr:MAG: methionine--tRNA ligase [Candidatus Moranbacteria bacterium]